MTLTNVPYKKFPNLVVIVYSIFCHKGLLESQSCYTTSLQEELWIYLEYSLDRLR